MTSMHTHAPRHQQGTALIIALVMLIAMTVLGLTSARSTLMQEQMTGNKRQKQVAFEAAEAALRTGEGDLWSRLGGAPPNARQATNCSPCDVLQPDSLDPVADATWSGGNVRQGPNMPGLAQRPAFFIEQQQTVPLTPMTGRGGTQELRYYTVTGRATGEEARVESILQSTFVLIF